MFATQSTTLSVTIKILFYNGTQTTIFLNVVYLLSLSAGDLITCMYVYTFTFSWYCHYLLVDKGIIQLSAYHMTSSQSDCSKHVTLTVH